MKRVLFVVAVSLGSVLGASRSVKADGPAPLKNLHVLPKTTTKEEIKKIMKAQSKALGVECDFCHEVPDMASDANGHKKVAREMMKMTDEINTKWIKAVVHDWDKHPVTCTTCHMGKPSPQ